MTRPAATPARRSLAGLAAALLALPAVAAAQGTLSMQGFGFPTGQLSTRALGTAGAIGEFDPLSPLNPASLSYHFRPTIGFQYDPELRSTTIGGGRAQNATVARFPLLGIALPVRGGVRLGLSASTLLDRSFSTEFQTTTDLGDTDVVTDERVESRGSIADIRLGLGMPVRRWLRVGVAGHLYTGENRVVYGRTFADASGFATIADSSTIAFRGSAVSTGIELSPLRGVNVGASYRLGQSMRAQRNDTTLTRGDVPDRVGVGLRVDRVSGASFVASWARTGWSSMRGLGSAQLRVRDTDELRGGVEAVGPRLGDVPILLRLGASRRTLPFGIGGADVRETALGGGVGLPLGGGRAALDLGAQRATRRFEGNTAELTDVRERAWMLSVGLTVRP